MKEQIHPLFQEVLYNEFSGLKKQRSPIFGWLTNLAAEISYVPQPVPGIPLTEQQLVQTLINQGDRNENSLSDVIFHRRHPELNGTPLSTSMPNFSSLSREWLQIRDTIVRPLLQAPASSPQAPADPAVQNKLVQNVSISQLLNVMKRKRYIVYRKPYQLNIVGVRAENVQANSFDDCICIFYKDNLGSWVLEKKAFTSDPGTYYLNNPMNVSGTAIVVPGQYINSHKIGLHKGEYTALVQQGPINIIRDTNKDNVLDFTSGTVVTGIYGINIHRASSTGTSTDVNKWSAGCQVFANNKDFDRFISLCLQHKQYHGDNFTYTLIMESDLYTGVW